MKKITDLIENNNLQVIDAIVLKKRFIGMVDHFVLFGGYTKTYEPIFVANYKNGVQVVPPSEMITYLGLLEPERILRFKGNDVERELAIQRANSRLGERAYDYLANNCEHFVTWVHTGTHHSKQGANGGAALMTLGAVSTIGGYSKKNDLAIGIGIGAMLLGAILKFGFNEKETD